METLAPVITARDLSVGYIVAPRKTFIVANGLSLDLVPGEMVCLLGPNGAGKSTLIRTLAGMQRPISGQIQIAGRDLSKLRPNELARLLAVVLTEGVSAGLLSVEALVALGRYPYTDWTGRLSSNDRDVIRWAIHAVDADHLSGRSVANLSDGERQKIMIARALAQQPRVLILDEVTAFLDLPRRVEIMRTLRHLGRSTGTAILLSTHELDLALRSADRIWLLAPNGPLRCGAPEDLVLQGGFASVFHGEGVHFDSHRGAFQIHSRGSGTVQLTGEGLHRFWTAHALEREGFDVRDNCDSAKIHVEVSSRDGLATWQTELNGDVRLHSSIYNLLLAIRAFADHTGLPGDPFQSDGISKEEETF